MKNLNFLIKKYIYQIVIVLLVGLLFFLNYKPDTYLTGWDNLQTDLYPWVGVKRAFFAVWQEYQSFGLVGGMGHAADLVRSVFIWIISYIIPQNMIRYFFHMGMLLTGGLGMFMFLQYVGFKNERKKFAFLGALFYLLNFGTIQIFYLPFEAFSVFFGFLPWELWVFMRLLDTQKIKKKDIVLFITINILATPQAYVQTLFLIYGTVITCFILGKTIQDRSVNTLKRGVVLLFLIFIVNSFWILPQVYFLKNGGGSTVANAKSNALSTNDVFYQNKEKGTFLNFVKMEGFYFDLVDANKNQLFAPWRDHFQNPVFGTLRYLLGGLVLLGALLLIKKRKEQNYAFAFVFIYLLCAVGLLIDTFPFSLVNAVLRGGPFINQIFRSPFTKFIIPYAFVSSFFFTFCISFISDRFFSGKRYTNVCLAIGAVIIIFYSLPAFHGYFFAPQIKISIPSDYFQVMEYFKTADKDKRIALLPDYTFWGWFFHSWGYDGSGFLWYGIEQPIVSRTFDVWSNKSESYFWEMKTALEAEDEIAFENVLSKYRIDYLLFDNSLVPVSASTKGMQLDRTETLLAKSKKVELVQQWQYVSLYRVKTHRQSGSFIEVVQNPPNIGPQTSVTNDDRAYSSSGDYKTDPELAFDRFFPFTNLMSFTNIFDKRWAVTETDKAFILSADIPVSVDVRKLKTNTDDPLVRQASFDGRKLTVPVTKKSVQTFEPLLTSVENCGYVSGFIEKKTIGTGLTIKSSDKATACFGYYADLEQQYGYLIKIENKNINGRRMFFYVNDQTKKQSIIEARLEKDIEYFILPPKFKYGIGYSFNFQNNSYRDIESENVLENITIYSFPYEYLKGLNVAQPTSPLTNDKSVFTVDKKNYFLYEVNLNRKDTVKTVMLSQSFDPGWKAYSVEKTNFFTLYFPFLFRTELKDHFMVNNWANGWSLSPGQNNIVIIFWPQYLEFLGFGMLIASLTLIIGYKHSETSD